VSKGKNMQWFKRKNNDAWTAIRTSGDSTSIAQVTRRRGDKPLVNLAVIENSNIRALKNTEELAKKYKLGDARCTFVFDSRDYQLLQVEAPSVPNEELKDALRWKIKDMIDYPVEQATVDFLTIPQDAANPNRQSYVYAIAAKNELIGQISNNFADAGINLTAIDVRVTAQRNIAALLEQENRGLAMLSFGRNGGLLTFTSGGELYHTRFIEIDEGSLESVLERISLELQRSLDNFDRQFPFIAVNKLLVAPCAEQETLIQHFKTALYIQVEGFKLNDVFDFGAGVELDDLSEQAGLFHAIGAALREEVAA
jgi:MSHA biogenesis protein MshI